MIKSKILKRDLPGPREETSFLYDSTSIIIVKFKNQNNIDKKDTMLICIYNYTISGQALTYNN